MQGPQGDMATEPLCPLLVLLLVFFVRGDLVMIVCMQFGWTRVFLHCLLFCLQVRPPGPLHSDSGVKILSLILALGGLQWARGSVRLFLVLFLLVFAPLLGPLPLLLLLLLFCRRRSC